MTRILRKISVTLQQQNSPAPWEGAGQRMNGGATDERTRSVVVATPEAALGTKTPRLPSKGTPHNEDQEVTQDQRI